jgi:hypothetical protein
LFRVRSIWFRVEHIENKKADMKNLFGVIAILVGMIFLYVHYLSSSQVQRIHERNKENDKYFEYVKTHDWYYGEHGLIGIVVMKSDFNGISKSELLAQYIGLNTFGIIGFILVVIGLRFLWTADFFTRKIDDPKD